MLSINRSLFNTNHLRIVGGNYDRTIKNSTTHTTLTKKIVAHTEWSELKQTNNIAIVFLLQPVPDTLDILKTAVMGRFIDADMENCLISGWGYMNDTMKSFPTLLNVAVTQIISKSRCEDQIFGKISDDYLCTATNALSASTCEV